MKTKTQIKLCSSSGWAAAGYGLKRFVLLAFACCAFIAATAQNRVVTGTVTSEGDNLALPGVSVIIKGTTTGTVTDADGRYNLAVAQGGTLMFSFIGYKTVELDIGERSVIDVAMEFTLLELDEIVVTGVGVGTEQRKLPIEVASLKSKELVPGAIGSIDQAIQGKIAGAQVQINSGEPGASAYIQLRGINSLGSSQPIILLDGVQITSISGLDLTNIDRIEVVKGAAAGMLYGAQGANGVIQIFSKRGSNEKKLSVTVSSRYLVEQVLKGNTPLVAAKHHYDTDSQGFILSTGGNRIAPDSITGTWSEPSVNLTPDLKNDKAYLEKTHDHFSQVYRTAESYNTTVNISGGTGPYDYSLNVNWLDQANVLFGDLDRKNISLNLGAEIFKGLHFRTTTQMQLQNENLMSDGRFQIVNSYPWVDFNATYANGYKVIRPGLIDGENPLSQYEWQDRGSNDNRIIQSFNLNYKFQKIFSVDFKYGVQAWNTNRDETIYNQQGFLKPDDAFWGPAPGRGSYYLQNDKSVYQNSLLSIIAETDFRKDFGLSLPITTSTQLTYDWRKDQFESFWGQATDFPFPPYSLTLGQNKSTGSSRYDFITYGYLVNQVINYGNIAGISLGFRSDFSSEFGFNQTGSEVKPFTFPRGTFFFNPSQFFKGNLITNWKLRAAYGEAGIQPNQYARQPVYVASTFGDKTAIYTPYIVSNPALRVQRTKELEFGTDLILTPSFSSSWFSMVSLTFSAWQRRSEDVIQSAEVAPSTGQSGIIDNLLSLKAEGLDLGIDVRAFKSENFTWNLGVRLGTAETLVEKISNGLDVPYGTFMLREGQPVGMFNGQVVLTSLDEIRPDSSFYIAESDRGNYEVVSTKYGPVVVDTISRTALISDPDDQRLLGNPQPKLFGSFTNDFTIFSNLSINMQWDFSLGGKIYNGTRQWMYRDRLSRDFDDAVTVGGESGAWVALYNSLYNSVGPLSWFVEDGSFARLRNLSVSYDLQGLIKSRWVNQLTVTLIARNLVTITKYTGLDPESASTGVVGAAGNAFGYYGPIRGADSFGFPNLKSYQVGITYVF